jgi:hypothetical protein
MIPERQSFFAAAPRAVRDGGLVARTGRSRRSGRHAGIFPRGRGKKRPRVLLRGRSPFHEEEEGCASVYARAPVAARDFFYGMP